MKHNLDPRPIIRGHFRPHDKKGEPHFSGQHLALYVFVPAVTAWLVHQKAGAIEDESIPTVLAVYGILSAVLAGLLPLVYSIIGQSDLSKRYTPGERFVAERELNRIYTLQDLYATISYSTLLLVLAIFCCVAIGILPVELVGTGPSKVEQRPEWAEHVAGALSVATYLVGISTAFSILDVGNGIFDAMQDQVDATVSEISGNICDDSSVSPDDGGVSE